MNVLIGGAWPYANGSLHIGHIAALLPGDVLARYHRLKGDKVCYVSGSDCHGTPIMIKARQENKTPEEVYRFYHREFCDCFKKLGFSYDHYGKTSDEGHINFVREFHKQMYKSKSVVEKVTEQAYCEACEQFLPDRFVVGVCPRCGKDARGDQCDNCGCVFDSAELEKPSCALCGREITLKETKHLYLKLKDFEDKLINIINPDKWRRNAIDFTKRYINEGLVDRALTRDIELGIDAPKEGYEGKKIYIWAENVLGYLSGCYLSGNGFEDFYKNDDSLHYYVHGKDNIPFHSIILPTMLLAVGEEYHLPDAIVSSEFMTLEGQRISTSKNHAVWANELADKYNPDSVRYFFIANSPEKRDADFTFREFVNNNNGELLGCYGNFVNRTLVFIEKYFDATNPKGCLNNEIKRGLEKLYEKTVEHIEAAEFKAALEGIFEFIRGANKYYDTEKPWATRHDAPDKCAETLYNCLQIIANLSILLEPFLPFSSAKIRKWLGVDNVWGFTGVPSGIKIPKSEILFERIEIKG